MATDRAVTPTLKKYLKEMNLSRYTTNFEQFGIVSVSKIGCLPPEEDTTFIKQLNINQSDTANWIKFRIMVNAIRNKFKNSQSFIQNDNENTIDLTKPEPITNFNIKCNTKDIIHSENDTVITNCSNMSINDEIQMETETNNDEKDTNGTNEKHFMRLHAKYDTNGTNEKHFMRLHAKYGTK
eukprot:57067_1